MASRAPVLVRNSLRRAQERALEALTPTLERPLKWYACGPTVYDSAHLGHARTYVCQDIIRRILEDVFGHQVFYCVGVTDVDDKIITRARASKQDPSVISRRYEAEFWQDMDALGVQRPSAVVRVTEHLDVIKEYITGILDKGMAYRGDDGVYFDVAEFSKRNQYGKLSPDAGVQGAGDGTEPGARGKRDPRDFALWKLAKAGEPVWDSPWGPGRPGWHIECSAMTHHVLGGTFDLHSGGVDLKFPHHTNEIAQCEAFHGPQHEWCPTWIHTGHLYIKGLKMSKSLKNFITIRALLLDHDPDDFRVFCLQHHYSANVDYSESQMSQARGLRHQLLHFTSLSRPASPSPSPSPSPLASKRWGPAEFQLQSHVHSYEKAVREALRCDFDTPEALRQLQGLMSAAHTYEHETRHQKRAEVQEGLMSAARSVSHWMERLGLRTAVARGGEEDRRVASREELTEAFVDFRSQTRALAISTPPEGLKTAVLQLCDSFRDGDLRSLGVQVQDFPGGQPSRWALTEKAHPPTDSLPAEEEEKKKKAVDLSKVPAKEMFRHGPHEGKYSMYDEDGIPTHTAEGKEVSKTQRAKLVKKWFKHQGLPVGGKPPAGGEKE